MAGELIRTAYFMHQDHLGSTRVMTSLAGTVSDSMDYLPYGEQISGGSTSTHKFTGKERDLESGLDEFGARYYASSTGRFSSSDPVAMAANRIADPQQINLYAYARNNPLIFVDPTGETIDFANKDSEKKFNEYVQTLDPDSDEYKTVIQLQSSDINYVINVGTGLNTDGSDSQEGHTTTDGKNVLIDINNEGNGKEKTSLNGRMAHELEHGRQVDNGELSFVKVLGKWMPNNYDIGDEVNAFKAQLHASPGDGNKGFLRDFALAKSDEERGKILARNSSGYATAAKNTDDKYVDIPGYKSGDIIKLDTFFGRQH